MILPTKEQFLAALARTEQLSPAPRTLGRALRLLRDPDSGLAAIAELISRDSALAVDVLRCANSAYYSRETRVADVTEAVHVIGFHETIRLVSLVATNHTTNRDLGSYGIGAEDFWAESLFNGLLLEALAKHTGATDPGEAYTTGLLRLIGRLAINQVIQDLGGGLFWDGATPMSEWERENVGLTQAEVGGQLLRKWEFPEATTLAVEIQDFTTLPDADTQLPLVQAAHFVACVFPAGGGLAAIEASTNAVSPACEDHPFATAHGVTVEMFSTIRADAHRAFIGVRETLYH
jgi:HD-like signal output (HDOD) protein